MGKRSKKPIKKVKGREDLIKSVNAKLDRYQRAINGDSDALIECMYERKMFSKEGLDDYYKTKEKFRDKD